jgi:hypothetical protein
MSADVVETTLPALAHRDVEAVAIAVRRDPEEVLQEAARAAKALTRVLDLNPKPVIFGGERYLEVGDWSTLGRFYGITAKVESVAFHVYEIPGREPICGFDAVAVALAADGRVVSRAEASCLSDEDKWSERPKYAARYAKYAEQVQDPADGKFHTVLKGGKPIVKEWYPPGYEPAQGEPLVWLPNPKKPGKSLPYRERALAGAEAVPLFQLKSMAQTRASAKVYRMVLEFVVKLAGYQTTPAEEMKQYLTQNGTTADVTTGEIIEGPDDARAQAGSAVPISAAGGLRKPERTTTAAGGGVPSNETVPGPAAASAPTKKPAAGKKEDARPITDPQKERLYRIAKEAGWTPEEVEQWVAKAYGVKATADIRRDQYDEICGVIRGSTR